MIVTRRNFLKTMLAACAAPAIVKASSLMPIFVPKQELVVYPEFKIVESVTGRLGASFAYLDELGFYRPPVGAICSNRMDNKFRIYTGESWRQIAA